MEFPFLPASMNVICSWFSTRVYATPLPLLSVPSILLKKLKNSYLWCLQSFRTKTFFGERQKERRSRRDLISRKLINYSRWRLWCCDKWSGIRGPFGRLWKDNKCFRAYALLNLKNFSSVFFIKTLTGRFNQIYCFCFSSKQVSLKEIWLVSLTMILFAVDLLVT